MICADKSPKPGKNYWLIIHPYVYISVKGNWILFFNTVNSQILEYVDNQEILQLAKKLNAPEYSYVIRLNAGKITKNISQFISELRDKYFGDLIDATYSHGKPFIFKPSAGLRGNVQILSTFKESAKVKILENNHILHYLKSLHIQINNQCEQKCLQCRQQYRQFAACSTATKTSELSLESIKSVIAQTEGSKMNKLIISGGNIFAHSELDQIGEFLKSTKNHDVEFRVNYKNVPAAPWFLRSAQFDRSYLKVYINFPVDEAKLDLAIRSLNQSNIPSRYIFLVEDESHLRYVGEIAGKNDEQRISIMPCFTGRNLEFFKQNVFINRADISGKKCSLRNIFFNQKMNGNYFGNLFIRCDGNVFSDLNDKRLGSLYKMSLQKIILQELIGGRAWAKVRREVEPCGKCVYQDLCPPVSTYEQVMGIYQVCDIWTQP